MGRRRTYRTPEQDAAHEAERLARARAYQATRVSRADKDTHNELTRRRRRVQTTRRQLQRVEGALATAQERATAPALLRSLQADQYALATALELFEASLAEIRGRPKRPAGRPPAAPKRGR